MVPPKPKEGAQSQPTDPTTLEAQPTLTSDYNTCCVFPTKSDADTDLDYTFKINKKKTRGSIVDEEDTFKPVIDLDYERLLNKKLLSQANRIDKQISYRMNRKNLSPPA